MDLHKLINKKMGLGVGALKDGNAKHLHKRYKA